MYLKKGAFIDSFLPGSEPWTCFATIILTPPSQDGRFVTMVHELHNIASNITAGSFLPNSFLRTFAQILQVCEVVENEFFAFACKSRQFVDEVTRCEVEVFVERNFED